MNEENLILTSIEALKRRLRDNNSIVVQQREGALKNVTFTFNNPTRLNEIQSVTTSRGWELPRAYEQFLLTHNGAKLFSEVHYGGGITLLSLQQIVQFHEDYEIPSEWYPVAWSQGIVGSICIDSTRVKKNEPYLLWFPELSPPEEAVYLNYGIEIWLDRLIVCQGEEFWIWELEKI